MAVINIPAISPYLPVDFGDIGRTEAIVNDFDVRALLWGTVEGPQAVIEWTPPLVHPLVSELRLVRKQSGPPETVDDGLAVLTISAPVDAVTSYNDFDVEECTCYFYVMFSQRLSDGVWFAGEFDDDMTARPAFHGQKFFELLPEIYVAADRRRNQEDRRQVPLQLLQDVTPGFLEFMNLVEAADGSGTERGQLERLLKVLGTQFDLAKWLIDCFPEILNVDTTCSRFLPLIADIVGLDLNRELTVIRQREEIRNAVATWKIKGTSASIEGSLQAVTGYNVIQDPQGDNVILFNRPDRNYANLNDLAALAGMGCPGDEADYVYNPNNFANFSTVRNYVIFDGSKPLNVQVLGKIARVIPETTPADISSPVTVKDETGNAEIYDSVNTVQEASTDATNP